MLTAKQAAQLIINPRTGKPVTASYVKILCGAGRLRAERVDTVRGDWMIDEESVRAFALSERKLGWKPGRKRKAA